MNINKKELAGKLYKFSETWRKKGDKHLSKLMQAKYKKDADEISELAESIENNSVIITKNKYESLTFFVKDQIPKSLKIVLEDYIR